jgi:hypothetical protein
MNLCMYVCMIMCTYNLGYDIRKVQKIHVGLKVNSTHHILVTAYDVNLFNYNIETIKETIEI